MGEPLAPRDRFVASFRRIAVERLQRIGAAIVAAERSPDEATLAETARELHTLKGEAGLVGLGLVATTAHRMEDLWALARTGAAAPPRTWDLLLRGLDLCGAVVTSVLSDEEAGAELAVFEADVAQLAGAGPSGEVSVPAAGAATGTSPAGPAPARPRRAVDAEGGTVPLATADLERLVAASAHLGTTSAVLVRELSVLATDPAVTPEMRRALRACLDRARELQERGEEIDAVVQATRMEPLSRLLDDLPRQVRDACRAAGRRARVETSGRHHGVDGEVLGALRDVLVHVVRNAIDHGIEPPSVRAARGKEPEGRIRVDAAARGSELELVVEDDGAGIDTAGLRRAAADLGMSSVAIEHLAGADHTELAFHGGVSTATALSETSGRGVGLDAVRRRIARIGGTVRLESEPGAWTRVRIVVPVSLASARLTIARAGALVFAVPATMVAAVEHGDRSAAWVRHDERVVPLLHWHDRGDPRPDGPILVVKGPLGLLALSVDRVIAGALDAVTSPVPALLAGHPLLIAVALLGGDQVVPVIDVARLGDVTSPAPSTAAVQRALTRRRVVVADDSPLTLTVLVELLQGLGYEVFPARDGREALTHVRERKPDLLLTDLDMPQMGGIELVKVVRSAPATRDLPVVVLTSRGDDEDRRRGADAGADAYVTKSELRYEQLAELLTRLLGARS